MSEPITETDAYPATLSTPVANELGSASALLEAFLQGAANRFKYLHTVVDKFRSGGTVALGGPLTLSGEDVTVDTLVATVGATVEGLNVIQSSSLNDVSIGGDVSVAGEISAWRRHMVTGADADTTVTSHPSGTLLYVPTLSATRAYNFLKAGAVAGDHFWIIVNANSNDIDLQINGALALNTGANTMAYAAYSGTDWVFASWSASITNG